MLCANYDKYQDVNDGLMLGKFYKGRYYNEDISRARDLVWR